MGATNTQMILLCMATLAFLNLAAGLIKSDAKCPPHRGTVRECTLILSDIEER